MQDAVYILYATAWSVLTQVFWDVFVGVKAVCLYDIGVAFQDGGRRLIVLIIRHGSVRFDPGVLGCVCRCVTFPFLIIHHWLGLF